MKKSPLENITVMPESCDPVFTQRELNLAHTSYREETAFFSYVQQGNVEAVKGMLSNITDSGLTVGRMSKSPLRQMQYWAVCCITLGARYAIQGGLDEMQAYNISDRYINAIDVMDSPEKISEYLATSVMEITELVRKSSLRGYPSSVRKCIRYIELHLHENICLSDLEKICNQSGDHLSRLFKKHTGSTVKAYILAKKLKTAKSMLKNDTPPKLVGYYLGFCSQTYFITCFKKAYGITPHRYAVSANDMSDFPNQMDKQ